MRIRSTAAGGWRRTTACASLAEAASDTAMPSAWSASANRPEVTCSPDLKVAIAYVLPLGGGHREEALDALRRNRSDIRRVVGKGLQLRFTPEIRFVIDETFDRLDDTRAMFADENVRRDLDRD